MYKEKRREEKRTLAFVLTLCGSAMLSTGVARGQFSYFELPNPGQTRWWIVPLGAPCGCASRTPSIANSINDCGEIVGETGDNSYCPQHAWVWTLCETLPQIDARSMQGIGALTDAYDNFPETAEAAANAINNDAVVVGSLSHISLAEQAPFWWNLLSTTTNPACSSSSCACGIALSDYVTMSIGNAVAPGSVTAISESANPALVGTFAQSASPSGASQAWISHALTQSGSTLLLPIQGVPNTIHESAASAVSFVGNAFRVAGASRNKSPTASRTGADDAVTWVPSFSTNALSLSEPNAAGVGLWSERALGSNDFGDICGAAFVAPSFETETAVWWTANGAAFDVGTLFSPATSSARALSERDTLGNAIACGDSGANSIPPQTFVWWTKPSPRFPVAPNTPFHGVDFADPLMSVNFMPGVAPGCMLCPKLVALRGINARGWMVGATFLSSHIEQQAALVLPAPCQADFDNDGFVNASDLATLMNAWGSCASGISGYCVGDLNDDGIIGAQDLSALLNAWTKDDPTPCSLNSLCDTFNCRGSGVALRATRSDVLIAISRYDCSCCEEFGWLVGSLCEETQRAVVADVEFQLRGNQ